MPKNLRDLSASIRAIHVYACYFGRVNGPRRDATNNSYRNGAFSTRRSCRDCKWEQRYNTIGWPSHPDQRSEEEDSSKLSAGRRPALGANSINNSDEKQAQRNQQRILAGRDVQSRCHW
jgi:hypothetical protein